MKEDKSRYKSSLERKIEAQFKKGFRVARDPHNSLLPDNALKQTTIYSDWYTKECTECKLVFREEDQVRVCPKCGDAYHEDLRYNLACWSDNVEDGMCPCGDFELLDEPLPQKPEEEEQGQSGVFAGVHEQFYEGLRSSWKDFGEESIRVQIAQDGDPVIGKRCPMCRFKIRPGDRYIQSPCGCLTFFHNDLFRHLSCWNNWNGKDGKGHCPVSGQKCSFQHTKTRFQKISG